jgi:hypothetical protein
MYDLSNSTTLAQKIVVGSVFSVTEILTIKYHKLNITFLHVAFGSQSLLKPISDQTTSDTDWSTGEGDQGGGGEWEPIKILYENLTYVPNSTRRASLLARPRPHSYRKAIDHQNRIREMKTQRNHNKMQVKPEAKTMSTKNRTNGVSLPHKHFFEHLVNVIKKLPQEHSKN